MKCRWKHCRYGGVVDKKDAVKIGGAYYHKDCYVEKKSIQSIIDIYKKEVDPEPIEKYLRRTINDLVFKCGNSAEFLLFAFRYCLDNGWTIKTPAGLRFVSKDGMAKAAWERKLKTEADNVSQVKIDSVTNYEVTPLTTVKKQDGFASILGR